MNDFIATQSCSATTDSFNINLPNEYELENDECSIYSDTLMDSPSAEFPPANKNSFSTSERHLIQNLGKWALSSIGKHEDNINNFDRGQCFEEMGKAQAKCGHTTEALCLFDLALQAKREECGDDDATLISTLLNRARAFGKMDLIRSCSEYKEVIQMKEKTRSAPCISSTKKDDLFLAKVLLELAHVQCKRGDFTSGIQNFNTALNIRVGHLGTQHDDVAFVWYLIGKTYHIKRDYKEAMLAYRNSLKIFAGEDRKKSNHALIQVINRLVSDRTMLAEISKEHWGDNTI